MQFQFTQYSLGHRKAGEIIQVNLSGSAANVRLMDSSNFQNYKSGRQHRYFGGLAKQSPLNYSTATHTVEEIAGEITEVIRQR